MCFFPCLSPSSLQRILQPYVDDLFRGIFAVPRGKPLAKAIKFLYDFLDLQVSNLSVYYSILYSNLSVNFSFPQ